MKSRVLNLTLLLILLFLIVGCADDNSVVNDKISIVENNSYFQTLARIVNIGFIITITIWVIRKIIEISKTSTVVLFILEIAISYLTVVGLLYFFEYCGWFLFVDDSSIWYVGLIFYLVSAAYGVIMYFIDAKVIIALIIDLVVSILLFLIAQYFIDQVVILNLIIPLIIFYVINEIKGAIMGALNNR